MRSVLTIIFVFSLLFYTLTLGQGWKDEFDDICSRTDIAMSMTVEELRSLIDRCDRLKIIIEGLPDGTQRKIYLKRLQMCRGLFVYVLKLKGEE